MSMNTDKNNHSPSKRTMNQYLSETKVASILDGRFSVTKARIKKTCADMHLKIPCAIY